MVRKIDIGIYVKNIMNFVYECYSVFYSNIILVRECHLGNANHFCHRKSTKESNLTKYYILYHFISKI